MNIRNTRFEASLQKKKKKEILDLTDRYKRLGLIVKV